MKKICLVLCAALLVSLLGGFSALADEFSYPMETDQTLTWWISAQGGLSGDQQDRNNNPIMKWLQERVGVDIEFVMPPIGEEKTAFTLMCATGDLTDIVSGSPNEYTGGLQSAINDGICLVLDDYMEYLPNLKARLDGDSYISLNMKSADGQYAYFPSFTLDPYICCWCGWQLRADWLEELGLEDPETMEDWYNALTLMKEKYNLEAGMAIRTDLWEQCEMATAYNTSLSWDINDAGEVEYGPATTKYLDWLKEMNKWYSEGLLHPDISTMDDSTAKSLYSSGKVAAVIDSVGAMTNFTSAGRALNESFTTLGATYPVLERGAQPYRGYRNLGGIGMNTFINGSIDPAKLEVACRVLDYGYSADGEAFYNFGVEGESFEYVDGYPTYTDMIMNNAEGYAPRTALELYTRASGFPGEQRREYFEQINNMPWQLKALGNWSNTDQDKHAYPAFAVGAAEQAERIALLQTDISTYVEEMRFQFIMGSSGFDQFGSYIATLDSMGFQELLELKKQVYADYLSNAEA